MSSPKLDTHVPLWILWQVKISNLFLSRSETKHVEDCEKCSRFLGICQIAESIEHAEELVKEKFGEVDLQSPYSRHSNHPDARYLYDVAFGKKQLTTEEQQHLNRCEECRRLHRSFARLRLIETPMEVSNGRRNNNQSAI
jgi:hypothetical protein